MRIDDIPVPQELLDEYCAQVDELDSKAVLTFLRNDPMFLAGHRPIERNVPAARERIKASLRSSRPLDPGIGALLADGGLQKRFVSVLSEEALSSAGVLWGDLFGPYRFVCALLLDSRPEVRALAREVSLVSREGSADSGAREAAIGQLREHFAPFLSEIEPLSEGAPTRPPRVMPDRAVGNELDRLRKRIGEAEEEARAANRTSRARINEVEKLARAAAAHSVALERAQANLVEANRDVDLWRSRYKEADAARSALEKGFDSRLSAAIETELSRALRPWFAHAVSVTDACKQAGASDAIGRAQAALQAQRNTDRHWGNLAALSERLVELRRLHGALEQARQQAIRPLAELKPLADELRGEIASIEQTLGTSTPSEGLAHDLRARLNEVRTLDELGTLRLFLHEAVSIGVLTVIELRALNRLLNFTVTRSP